MAAHFFDRFPAVRAMAARVAAVSEAINTCQNVGIDGVCGAVVLLGQITSLTHVQWGILHNKK
jgi:hypothetical protein